MTVEQIAIRQEIRQMLSEAGINKTNLKNMVKEVLQEEIRKAIAQSIFETNTEGIVSKKVEQCIAKSAKDILREEIYNRVTNIFNRMTISVKITDNDDQSITT